MTISIAKNVCRACMLASTFAVLTCAQVTQDHAELCGRPNEPVPLPPDITAVSSGARTDLLIKLKDGTAKIEMPGIANVRQVCPLSQRKVLVFGLLDPVAYGIFLVSGATGALLDDFGALDPLLSPDRRWLAFRRFRAVSAEVSISEQYLLYDLSKDAKGNRVSGADPKYTVEGRVMYPTVQNDAPLDQYGLPPDQVHRFRARSFHWAPDSKSVVFADEVRGQLSVIWVRLGPDDRISAQLHPVASVSEVCRNSPPNISTADLTLTSATVGMSSITGELAGPATQVLVEFASYDGACMPRTVTLYGRDFKPPELERPAPAGQKMRAVKKDR